MKTDFLTGLGLTKEQVDAIMAENGKDVNAEKAKVKERETQLAELQEKLKAFDGADITELKNKIKGLTDNIAAKDAEYAKKVSELEFSKTLESAIAGAKPRNNKAVMALMDMDALKESKNQQADILAALEAVKKDNDYLFEQSATRAAGSTPGVTVSRDGDGSGTSKANEAMRTLFGKTN